MMTCLPGQVISQNQEEIYNCEEQTLGAFYHKRQIQNPYLWIYTIGEKSSFSEVLYACMLCVNIKMTLLIFNILNYYVVLGEILMHKIVYIWNMNQSSLPPQPPKNAFVYYPTVSPLLFHKLEIHGLSGKNINIVRAHQHLLALSQEIT